MIRKLALILIISGFALVITSQMYTKQEIVKWVEYDKSIELAKELKKPVFIYFYSDSCSYCKLMSSEVFSDEEVANLLNSKFVPTKTDVRTDISMVKRFAPVFQEHNLDFVTPSYVIQDSSGKVIGIKAGYLSKNDFKNFILSVNK